MSSSSSSSSTENIFTLIGYLCVEVNGSDTKDHYIPLYNNSNTGICDRDFWGDVGFPDNLQEEGYLSTIINSTTYWFKIFKADPSTGCCTNLEGEYRVI